MPKQLKTSIIQKYINWLLLYIEFNLDIVPSQWKKSLQTKRCRYLTSEQISFKKTSSRRDAGKVNNGLRRQLDLSVNGE